MGNAHDKLNDAASAAAAFATALSIDPTDASAAYNLGNAYRTLVSAALTAIHQSVTNRLSAECNRHECKRHECKRLERNRLERNRLERNRLERNRLERNRRSDDADGE